ncbi:MAG: hypothetical protein GY938_24435 [Ketobacter sp.]|nr:hypothetical protein [Ketobacter sp.]
MAKTVYATYLGNGRLDARGAFDKRLLAETFETGANVKLVVSNPKKERGPLNYFFKWLAEIFANLPESCSIQFSDVEHLRAYMIYKAGFSTCWQLDDEAVNRSTLLLIRQMAKELSSDKNVPKRVFFEKYEGSVWAFVPDSIKTIAVNTKTFQQFFDEARAIAQELIPGLDMKLLEKRMHEEYLKKQSGY